MQELTEEEFDSKSFGEILNHYRKVNGYTMTEVAKEVGVSQSYISNLEHGKRTDPSYEVIFKIGDFLNIDPLSLIAKLGGKGINKKYDITRYTEEVNKFEEERGYDQLKDLNVLLSDDLVFHIETDSGESTRYILSAHLNGHRLKAEERERLLKVAELMFPHYSNNK